MVYLSVLATNYITSGINYDNIEILVNNSYSCVKQKNVYYWNEELNKDVHKVSHKKPIIIGANANNIRFGYVDLSVSGIIILVLGICTSL